ncbi:MAG: hypothetical protein AAGC88_10565 [Bacteroidota bacterium]
MEAKDSKLNKAIEDMPTYQAPEEVWDRIVDELDADRPLRMAIEDYRQQQLEAPDLFDTIIEAEKPLMEPQGKVRSLSPIWLSGIAAGLALLIGYFVLFNQAAEETITVVSYSETVEDLPEMMTAAMEEVSEDDEVMDFIKMHCQQVALTCNTPQFQGLFDLYIELDQSKMELMDVMQANQEQEQLADYLIRVEKEKDEVGKQLIQMIIG